MVLSVRKELDFIDGEKVALTRVGQIEISTVRLPRFRGQDETYETCLRHDSGNSSVAATYFNRLDAITGHMRFLNALQFALDPMRYDNLPDSEDL